jgi:hypothetical protein
LQLRQFNQTAAISSTTKLLSKATAAENEQQQKPSKSIEPNENQNQQQTKTNPEMTEEEQQKQQNETEEPQHLQLAKASIAIGSNRNIEIECRQGAHGHKIIHIIRFIIRKKTLKKWAIKCPTTRQLDRKLYFYFCKLVIHN